MELMLLNEMEITMLLQRADLQDKVKQLEKDKIGLCGALMEIKCITSGSAWCIAQRALHKHGYSSKNQN